MPSRLSSLPPSSDSDSDSDGDEATHILLYLNKSTWAGDGAEALAEQVRTARSAKLAIVMAHENDAVRSGCIFGHFFEVTPRDLIAGGGWRRGRMDGAGVETEEALGGAAAQRRRVERQPANDHGKNHGCRSCPTTTPPAPPPAAGAETVVERRGEAGGRRGDFENLLLV